MMEKFIVYFLTTIVLCGAMFTAGVILYQHHLLWYFIIACAAYLLIRLGIIVYAICEVFKILEDWY